MKYEDAIDLQTEMLMGALLLAGKKGREAVYASLRGELLAAYAAGRNDGVISLTATVEGAEAIIRKEWGIGYDPAKKYDPSVYAEAYGYLHGGVTGYLEGRSR